jgi:hypothetical protein
MGTNLVVTKDLNKTGPIEKFSNSTKKRKGGYSPAI